MESNQSGLNVMEVNAQESAYLDFLGMKPLTTTFQRTFPVTSPNKTSMKSFSSLDTESII